MPTFETAEALAEYMQPLTDSKRNYLSLWLLKKTRAEIEAWLKAHSDIEVDMRERLNKIKNNQRNGG